MAKLDELVAKEKAEEDKRVGEFQEILTGLEGKTIKLGVKAGTSGKIFGSITNIQVANALKEQFDLEIPRKKIEVDDIKELGSYTAKLNLHEQVSGDINIELVKE